MGVVKFLFTFCLLLIVQKINSQTKRPFYQNIYIGMDGSVGIPLSTVNVKEYYLSESEPIIHESGKNEPLYGGGFKLGYDLSTNQSVSLKHSAFAYTYDYNYFFINQFPEDRWTYEFALSDFTEFYFDAVHLSYCYKFSLGMLKPYIGIGLGHYWVEAIGFGRVTLTDSLYNSRYLYETQDQKKFRYFNLKPEFGFDLLFNQYFGMTVYGNFDIPLNGSIHYNFDYDSILEQTEYIARVERIFPPLNMFTFGLGMFFYLPQIKKAP